MRRAAVFLSTILTVFLNTSAAPLWPVPRDVSCTDGTRTLTSFSITTSSSSAVLAAAISRYSSLLSSSSPSSLADDASSKDDLSHLIITVSSDEEHLEPKTDYSYSLSITDSTTATISAPGIYGAIAGLETFSQLVNPSNSKTLVVAACSIQDSPSYQHRGLLVDSGRRFLPMSLLKTILDSMSYSKMNVLHLHLSDWAAVRLEIESLPELTAHLGSQVYSTKDAAELVRYAQERGIRVVPEIDVPAHATGFAPLTDKGLQFCDETKVQLYNDPATNTTLQLVTKVIQAVGAAFPDALFHLGGDETLFKDGDKCNADAVHTFEKQLQQVVIDLKRQPAVWNEVFSNPQGSQPNGALPGTIIQNWHNSASSVTTHDGFESLVSTYSKLYLDQQCCATGNARASNGTRVSQCYYFDIAEGVPTSQLHLVIGGETAMWSDLYCGKPDCSIEGPWSAWYPASKDEIFSKSFGNMVWPRASGAAGAFWNYDSSVDPNSPSYAALIAAHNSRLLARGAQSCRNECACDWNSECGVPYDPEIPSPKLPMQVKLTNTNKDAVKMTVKRAFPCQKAYGDVLAYLEQGESFTVSDDFIVTAKGADGDPFSLWFGGGGWRSFVADIHLQIDPTSPTYIDYVVQENSL